ncbi:type I-E CRISPR-associated protein Cas6/Cse3/CasE [Gordonia sihwensis]|uniref:type I-E CRISPR-associated protein Cas6/Cse3/CasE n=1 Tax=Gordonia sihwensis TaxID=173559 RepID=UPI00241676E4|nr:type I-E CRISPR-associated protein Cas6/Cse3/CasE [Gordonia sihwensis]WFN93906.1 type I-E CRISPR-associated protein Cas6/Cse3/CasE [Gordonia sihwensis]
MYMSRIALNHRRRGAVKLLGSRHAMHAAVMSAFAPGTTTESAEGRVLWRVDRRDDAVDLLIVSPSEPCLVHIGEQAGWTTGSPWATRDYTTFLESLSAGEEYVFRLTANPTHRMTADDGRKQIVGHVTSAYQRQWFKERAERHGFELVASAADDVEDPREELVVSERDTAVFRRGQRQVTLVTASFEGRLRVADADLLRRALTHGIGRAKGYGCGLMTLLPAS